MDVNPSGFESDDSELYTTAMHEACYWDAIDVLERFKPDSDMRTLGGKADEKPSGGSTAVDRCLWSIHIESFTSRGNKLFIIDDLDLPSAPSDSKSNRQPPDF